MSGGGIEVVGGAPVSDGDDRSRTVTIDVEEPQPDGNRGLLDKPTSFFNALRGRMQPAFGAVRDWLEPLPIKPSELDSPWDTVEPELPFQPPNDLSLCWKLVATTLTFWTQMVAISTLAVFAVSSESAQRTLHCFWHVGVEGFSTALIVYCLFYPIPLFVALLNITYETICRERVYYRLMECGVLLDFDDRESYLLTFDSASERRVAPTAETPVAAESSLDIVREDFFDATPRKPSLRANACTRACADGCASACPGTCSVAMRGLCRKSRIFWYFFVSSFVLCLFVLMGDWKLFFPVLAALFGVFNEIRINRNFELVTLVSLNKFMERNKAAAAQLLTRFKVMTEAIAKWHVNAAFHRSEELDFRTMGCLPQSGLADDLQPAAAVEILARRTHTQEEVVAIRQC